MRLGHSEDHLGQKDNLSMTIDSFRVVKSTSFELSNCLMSDDKKNNISISQVRLAG